MPSIAAHMAVAKLISDKLYIDKEEFYKGNILPDIIDIPDSHHKILGKFFYIPDIDYFKNNLDLTKPLNIGYLTHLLLDKYFLQSFVPDVIGDLHIFENRIIYKDYSSINYQLVEAFNLDVDYITKIFNDFNVPIDSKKLDYNIQKLSSTIISDSKVLKFEEFLDFIIFIADQIMEELEDYTSEFNNLSIYTRKRKK